MKIFEGVIVSIKMQKTAVVEVTRKKPHPLYRKLLKKSKKYFADSSDFSVSLGDKVKIAETKPISKHKHFEIIEIIGAQKKINEKVEEAETQDKNEIKKVKTSRKTKVNKTKEKKNDSA
ncbi:MAG: 30S ribosomal protein S17 [Candidatus Levybacteria bacterium]|nr:30S ribosomal protein S17 [Candidatus Levybacteria bacterium]